MSISTAVAPARSMAAMVATAVWETVNTRSPLPMPQARKASSIRSVAYTDGVGSPDESRESRLEGLDFLAKDVKAAVENASDGGIYGGALREIAGARIGLRNRIE